MEWFLCLYYIITALPSIWAHGVSFAAGSRSTPPLIHKYQWLSFSFFLLYVLIFMGYFIYAFTPQWTKEGEGLLGPFFGVMYGVLLWNLGKFYSELSQKPFKGSYRRIIGFVSFLGPLGTLGSLFLGSFWGLGVEFQRNFLQYFYVFLVLGTIATTSIREFQMQFQDEWKRKSVYGASWLLLAGLPLFIIDALWPLIQEEWKILPRGFNLHGIFFAAWHVWWGFRWKEWLKDQEELPLGLNSSASKIDGGKIIQWGLSRREVEVVTMVIQGCTNQEISQNLNLEIGTIKNHLYRIFNKSGTSSRRELALLAVPKIEAPTPTEK